LQQTLIDCPRVKEGWVTQTTKEAERAYLARILAGVELFASINEDDLSELARCGRNLAVERGKPIAAKGKSEEIYVIAGGAAALIDRAASGGVLTALLGPGDVIGLARAGEILGRDARRDRGEWRALSNLTLVAIPIADFLRVMRRSEELSAATIAALAKLLRDLAERHAAALQSPLETRLAAFLSQLAIIATGNRWEPQANIGRLPQTMIADMLGVSREHVNRTLTMWERSGLILQSKGGDIIIENRKRLSQLAGDESASMLGAERDAYWEISAHINLGLNSAAYDLAMEGVKRAPRDERFKYLAVLAMARMGALKEALSLVETFKLTTDAKNEDVASIGPRLRRDLAFAAGAAPDPKTLATAAADYEKVFRALKTTYPGVNAAAIWAMGGEGARAKKIAGEVRKLAEAALEDIDEDEDAYWQRATLAECRLIEGDLGGAAACFAAAVTAADAAPGKIATTRKQLKRLSATLPIDEEWIDDAAPQGAVLFFCGPLATADDDGPSERLKKKFSAFLDQQPCIAAIGALAAGADIIIAEQLIEAGVPLHVYLPLAPTEFLEKSVAPAGKDWRDRYIACIEAAKTIEWSRRLVPSRAAYRLGAQIAMGRAIRQADDLATEAVGVFAVQRGRSAADSISRENADIWRALGRRCEIIEDDWPAAISKGAANGALAPYAALVIEGDLGHGDKVCPVARFSTTNGGLAIFAFHSAFEAAAAAREFAGSPSGGKSRLWLDMGVADPSSDKGVKAFAQSLVTAACRPQTPPGAIYASDSFVGAASAASDAQIAFNYVGVTATAEKLDPCPLYLVDV